jgi:hypothetical protein
MMKAHDIYSVGNEANGRLPKYWNFEFPSDGADDSAADGSSDIEIDQPCHGADVWSSTLMILEKMSREQACEDAVETPEPAPESGHAKKGKRRAARKKKPPVCTEATAIRLVERVSDSCVLISWCDPTSCHYGEQTWILRTARSSGTCALSGMCIRRGDEVFRPAQRSRFLPANASAMILAESMRAVF